MSHQAGDPIVADCDERQTVNKKMTSASRFCAYATCRLMRGKRKAVTAKELLREGDGVRGTGDEE